MQKTNLKVSVIIPNYNGQELLAKNLPHVIRAYQNADNHIKEVIVVDDASTDGSVSFIKKNFPQVKIIQHKINRGFSASVNMGARSAHARLLALLNSDVIPDENFLVTVIPHFQNEETFAVSLHERGYGWAKGVFEGGFIGHMQGEESVKTHETFWVNGGSGVFRRRLWMKIGGMDERLLSPFYWEDVDLSYRAAKRGWINLWEPDAHVIHEHESTISKINKSYRLRIQERNQLIFIWKNLTSPNLFRKHVFGMLKRLSQHPGYIVIVFMAIKKIKFITKARNKEKKKAKISDEAIFAKFRNG